MRTAKWAKKRGWILGWRDHLEVHLRRDGKPYELQIGRPGGRRHFILAWDGYYADGRIAWYLAPYRGDTVGRWFHPFGRNLQKPRSEHVRTR